MKPIKLMMNHYLFNKYLDQYKKIFEQYYFDKSDKSSSLTKNHILNNKINNYIDFNNFYLIKKFIDNCYNNTKIKILDLGCGALDKSYILKMLYPKSELVGLEAVVSDDPGHKVVNKTRFNKPVFYGILQHQHNIKFGLYDGRNIPYPDNYFDVILLYAVLEHVQPQHRISFIKKTQQKLKRNGVFIIARCPQKYGLFEMISEKLSLGAHKWRMTLSDFDKIFPHQQYKIEKIKKLNNIFTEPTYLTNRLYYLLILVDKLLEYTRWPFFTDYFIIIRKII